MKKRPGAQKRCASPGGSTQSKSSTRVRVSTTAEGADDLLNESTLPARLAPDLRWPAVGRQAELHTACQRARRPCWQQRDQRRGWLVRSRPRVAPAAAPRIASRRTNRPDRPVSHSFSTIASVVQQGTCCPKVRCPLLPTVLSLPGGCPSRRGVSPLPRERQAAASL